MADATNAKPVRVNRDILTVLINLRRITLVIVASSKSNFHKHSFKLTKLRLDQMESQLDKGKGVLVGFFLVASGLGAAASTVVQKFLST